MALRFFADHCISLEIIRFLTGHGHEVLRLKDQMPVESPDSKVIEKAQELSTVLLSLNSDFADIVVYPPVQFKGIVALQLHSHPEITESVMRRLLGYLAAHPTATDYHGKLLVVEPHRIRIRQ